MKPKYLILFPTTLTITNIFLNLSSIPFAQASIGERLEKTSLNSLSQEKKLKDIMEIISVYWMVNYLAKKL